MVRKALGFTLIEMMVVISIALIMMLLIVPIFQVTTKTVQTVERKLAVYEAARNILDMVEADVKLAVANERGGHFSMKSLAWEDNDPFTPAGTTKHYFESRRDADAINYVKTEPAGFAGNDKSPFAGSKSFPLGYPHLSVDNPEGWKTTIRSTLAYQTGREWFSGDYEFSDTGERWNRAEQLADVGMIETGFIFYAIRDQWRYFNNTVVNTTEHWDDVPDFLGPGKEIKVPPGYAGDQGHSAQRRYVGIRLLDIDFAYWDDVAKEFKDPPDNTAIYFWPAPKAVRVTITVCDREKRTRLTLRRVIQVPTGLGDGVVTHSAPGDSTYDSPGAYNRTKYLPNLPAVYNGNGTTPWGSDFSTNTEKKMLQTPKPINWP
jgi:prepilin-type N-terminal cleavage/methylation domain-containing protein